MCLSLIYIHRAPQSDARPQIDGGGGSSLLPALVCHTHIRTRVRRFDKWSRPSYVLIRFAIPPAHRVMYPYHLIKLLQIESLWPICRYHQVTSCRNVLICRTKLVCQRKLRQLRCALRLAVLFLICVETSSRLGPLCYLVIRENLLNGLL